MEEGLKELFFSFFLFFLFFFFFLFSSNYYLSAPFMVKDLCLYVKAYFLFSLIFCKLQCEH